MSLEGLYRACLYQIHGNEMGLGARVVAVSVMLWTGAEAGLWLLHLTGVCDGHLSVMLREEQGWSLPVSVTLEFHGGGLCLCQSH